MTVREFMLKKYPTDEWMDCPVPKHHWETIQEYADKYHEAKVKNLSSNNVLAAVRLAKKVVEVLDKKSRNGCVGENYTWVGFQNGNGTECGVDIERLIKKAKRLLKNSR